MMINSKSNIGIDVKNELRVITNSTNEKCTFKKGRHGRWSQLTEIINGNRVIRMNKEGGTFAIESAGDLRFNVDGCHYTNVGRNSYIEVQGSMKTTTHGKNIECIEGGTTRLEWMSPRPMVLVGNSILIAQM